MSVTYEAISERVARFSAPLDSGTEGAGIDARYEKEHETLRIEIAKLDAASGGSVDWSQVITLATALLTTKSKDILVACHLAVGLYQTRGLTGLADGLAIVAEVSDRFWPNAFPPAARMRGRVSAIDWLVDRVNLSLADTPVTAADARAVRELELAVRRFSSVMGERFTDPSPATRPLSDNVARLKMSIPAEAFAALDAAPAPAPSPPAPAGVSPEITRAEVLLPEAPANGGVAADVSSAQAASVASQVDAAERPSVVDEGRPSEVGDPLTRLDNAVADWLAPIAGDAPGGQDAKFDAQHELVRNEVAKLESASGGAVDWKVVAREGGSLLQNKSKDFVIASYVGYALTATLRFEGLAVAIAILDGLLRDYWETGFPPVNRVRPRANALAWFFDKLGPWLEEAKVTADDREGIELLQAITKRFVARAREKFEDNGPALGPLQQAIQRLALSVPAPAPAAPPPPPSPPSSATPAVDAAPAPQASSAPLTGPAAPAIAAGGDPSQILRDISDYLRGAADVIGTAKPTHPAAIRLRRFGLFLPVELAPIAKDGRKTVLAGPPPQMRIRITTLIQAEDWNNLVVEGERFITNFRFWLDAHRAVAIALNRLGEKSAYNAAIEELRNLLVRAEGVETREFKDGTPFAEPATLEWIDTEVRATAGSGKSSSSGSSDVDLGEITKLSAAGKVDEALLAIDAGLRSSRSARDRFQIRLATARVCASAGAADVALGVFDDLIDEIERRRLDEWDPELVGECVMRNYETLMSKREDAGVLREKTGRLLRLLGRIDPQAAMKLTSNKR